MLFFDLQFDQLYRSGDMDELVAVEFLGFSGEKHVAVGAGHVEEDRRRLSSLEGFLVNDDLQAAVAVAELSRIVPRHPNGGLGVDGSSSTRQCALAGVARPHDTVVTFAFRRKSKLRLSFSAGLDRAFQNIVMLVASKLELPRFAAGGHRRWKEPICVS